MSYTDDLLKWVYAAGVRAVKTAAQAAVALIGAEVVGVNEIDWLRVASVAGAAAVLSLLTSVAGIPEVAGGAPLTTIAGGSK